ncbi:hypothetical protein [uncultured Tolumonas sp.]|uniref:hypothetical protein n=1 Tax=uncultured Tolumonas sp. TaxID=263765 RepID=UPI002930EBF6|nr:hypothetical protein [uncultured Tolumonas sp.]
MISPLGQRQVFQTANVEAVRQAQEVSEQIQRENAKKRAADDQMLEDEASVRVIAESEKIETSEREGAAPRSSPGDRRRSRAMRQSLPIRTWTSWPDSLDLTATVLV